MRYAWMDSALCAQTDPEIWFPEGSGASSRAAQRVCATCPVIAECGEHAQQVEDASEGRRYGAWAGLTASARTRQAPARDHRDRQILALAAQGFTAAEVGDRLGVTDRTVARVRAAHRVQEAAA
ncbi:WhiB family transcriptional regulator [Streptomyces sp. NPDC056347]|uniref:WhiB family transcriptional regulator n=1 Tax=Streptomyces sp. NPDC056347 TaxID=3345790 RepID=UPI0035DAA894